MVVLNNVGLIAANLELISLDSSNGLDVKLNNNLYSNLKPNLNLEFDDQFHLCHFTNEYLKNMALMFFEEHYYCPGGIQFVKNSFTSTKIVNTNASNRYRDKKIELRKSLTNPLIFLHEIVHAIIDEVDVNHEQHNESSATLCSHLDIYTNGAPGYLLDIVNRLEMHFKASEFGNLNYGIHYLPRFAYPSLEGYCMSNSSIGSPNLENEINVDLNNPRIDISKIRNEVIDNVTPQKLEPEHFYQLKFGDEYNILSKAEGFPIYLNKDSYIKLNVQNLNSLDNKYK